MFMMYKHEQTKSQNNTKVEVMQRRERTGNCMQQPIRTAEAMCSEVREPARN